MKYKTVKWVTNRKAASYKPQAPSSVNHEAQASSPKHKASSSKPQATRSRTADPG